MYLISSLGLECLFVLLCGEPRRVVFEVFLHDQSLIASYVRSLIKATSLDYPITGGNLTERSIVAV